MTTRPLCPLTDVRLTLGLMGLDEMHLRVLATSSDDETEKRNAKKGMYIRFSTSNRTFMKMPLPR